MKRYSLYNVGISLALLFLVSSCQAQKQVITPANKNATPETRLLLQNLKILAKKGVMFGHQDALAYGVTWRYEEGRSDIKDVVNDYPAVYGWDLGGMEHNDPKDIDGVPFASTKKWITEIYDRGGISTFSWHMDNPLTAGDSWDVKPNSLSSILPGGNKHELYKKWLDNAANFLADLKGSDGKMVPILYRPFHELTGTWFWWCQNVASPADFKAIWKFTFDYLVKEKKLNHLLFVYNTADFQSIEAFEEYYPGDNYVDLVSYDKYANQGGKTIPEWVNDCRKQLEIMTQFADKHNKVIAIAEIGYEQIPEPTFWTQSLQKITDGFPVSFVLVWRNHGWQEHEKKMHYYAPYAGHPSNPDFQKYYDQTNTFFQKDLSKLKIYSELLKQ